MMMVESRQMLSSNLTPRIPQVETLHYKSVLVRLMWIELQIDH